MLKYIHPRAYFPDFRHGSTVVASINPGGELLLQQGIETLFSKSGTASRTSCSVGTVAPWRRDMAIPARLASISARAGIVMKARRDFVGRTLDC